MPPTLAAASAASAAAIVSCLLSPLLLLPLLGFAAVPASPVKQPGDCYYDWDVAPLLPEVLWVTSRSAFLRARLPCDRPVRRDLIWRYQVQISENGTAPSTWFDGNCTGSLQCEIKPIERATSILVCTCTSTFPQVENGSKSCSSFLSVKLCPGGGQPSMLSDAACEAPGGELAPPLLRWRHRPDRACLSRVLFVVRTRGRAQEPREWSPWLRLGDASPDGRRLGGGVWRCAERPPSLCASLSPGDRGAAVQIGVRRDDDNNNPISASSEMLCRPSNSVVRSVPSELPERTERPERPERPKRPERSESGPSRGKCSFWRAVALTCLALIATFVISSVVVWDCRRRTAGCAAGAAARTPPAEGRATLPRPVSSDAPLPAYGDGPPAHIYDYVEMWSPPLPPSSPPPSLPSTPAAEYVCNSLYGLDESYVGRPRFKF